MSAVSNLVLEVQDAVCDAMYSGAFTDAIAERIAAETGAPIDWVWSVHEDMSEGW